MSGSSYIIFTLDGQQYEYDGAMPDEILARFARLLDAKGFWVGGYPAELSSDDKDPLDELPTALWEIAQVGGRVVQIVSTRGATGPIYPEDWKNPRIY